MYKYSLAYSMFLLTACASMHSNNPESLKFSIPSGSTLSLNKTMSITASETHGVIQSGKQIKDHDRNDYIVNCRLDFKKFGPRNIEPEKFIITRTEDGTNWISQPAILRYYTELYLKSEKDTDVIKMVCQEYGDQTDYHFTVADMQKTLGEFITFNYK